MVTRGTGREESEFPAPRDAEPRPGPEVGAVFALFPPLTKMPSGACPPPPAADPPFKLFPSVAPPDAPGCNPSGEIEMRAERFPGGTEGAGATGAGVAESAIRVLLSPVSCCAISGAAAFVSPLCCAARGADMGLTGRTGLGGACADEAMLISPACFYNADTSGVAVFWITLDAGTFGRIAASCSGVSRHFGRAGSDPAS